MVYYISMASRIKITCADLMFYFTSIEQNIHNKNNIEVFYNPNNIYTLLRETKKSGNFGNSCMLLQTSAMLQD